MSNPGKELSENNPEAKTPPKPVFYFFGDSIASGMAGREDDQTDPHQTHGLVSDDKGSSRVGAMPSDVLNQLKKWIDDGKGFEEGAVIVLSPGGTNNPDGIEEDLPKMLDLLSKQPGVMEIKIVGVSANPPESGPYADAGARIRAVNPNGVMQRIVKEHSPENNAAVKTTFSGPIPADELSPDGLHPKNYDKLKKEVIPEVLAETKTAAPAPATTTNPANPTAPSTEKPDNNNQDSNQAESRSPNGPVMVNPESMAEDLSPEVVKLNEALEKLDINNPNGYDISEVMAAYREVYLKYMNEGDPDRDPNMPAGYFKILLPNEVKGILPPLTVAERTSGQERYTSLEMASATYAIAYLYQQLLNEFPELKGDMIRVRDANSPFHKTHSRGDTLDLSTANGYDITRYSTGAALDYTDFDGNGSRFNKKLTENLLFTLGGIKVGDNHLFSSALFTGETVPDAVNSRRGRKFARNQIDHKDHTHLTMDGNVFQPLEQWYPDRETRPWGEQVDLKIGDEGVDIPEDLRRSVHGKFMDWIDRVIKGATAPGTTTTTAPGTTTTTAPETTTTTREQLKGEHTLEDFAIATLDQLADSVGVPRSNVTTDEHIIALIAFMQGEGGDIANENVYNPLNHGSNGSDGGIATRSKEDMASGFVRYGSFEEGVRATARTLNGTYQQRLKVVLANPNSTAEDFMWALSFWGEFGGDNLYWAEVSGNGKVGSQPSEQYYKDRLALVELVRNNYSSVASKLVGTEEENDVTRPDLLGPTPKGVRN